MVAFGSAGHPPRARAAGLVLARVHLPAAIGVGARIHGIFQQILQCHPAGAAPLQRPFGDAFANPYPQADVVVEQVAQQRMQGAQLAELVEDQAHDVLYLLVRVEAHLARGVADVADRQGKGQLAPARLVQLAVVQALLEDMWFGFRHRAFQPQQQAIVVLARIVDSIEIGNQRPK